MPRKESLTAPATAQTQQNAASDGIDNYELPKTLVTRIAKSAIPESSKLQKDTVTALVKGSTVFINYLAATAHDIATSRQHKSISASDVLKALEVIQFGDMVEPFQKELQIYRDNVKNSKKGGTGKSSAAGESVSARSKNAKGKGKERATGAGPSPLSASISAHASADEDMGEGVEAERGGEGDDEEGDEEVEDEEEDELADDVEEEDEAEPEEEEPADRMLVDEDPGQEHLGTGLGAEGLAADVEDSEDE